MTTTGLHLNSHMSDRGLCHKKRKKEKEKKSGFIVTQGDLSVFVTKGNFLVGAGDKRPAGNSDAATTGLAPAGRSYSSIPLCLTSHATERD